MTKPPLRSSQVLMDVGSTIIKYFRFDADGAISDGGYFPRDYARVVGEHAAEILQRELGWQPERNCARICSSANGGLGVGIIGYTERFSANWAAKAAFNAGANVRWATDVTQWPKASPAPVDIFVIAGGANGSPIARQIAWLDEVKKLPIQCDSVVFAGNPALHPTARKHWPDAIITDNVIGEDLRWQGEPLAAVLREAYLNDLVLHKGISGLQSFSEVAILPTPAVVQESYKAILNGETPLHLPAPLMLIDVGGATTDVFYGGELIADAQGNHPRPSINRHVFTYLGISASRPSLLERLSLSDRLGDFLRALDPSEAERRYLALREGATDWASAEFLAEACCFLALTECAAGLPGGHTLELERVASIAITGGASQICKAERLERIFRLCGARHATACLDEDYRIWIEGMARLTPDRKETPHADT